MISLIKAILRGYFEFILSVLNFIALIAFYIWTIAFFGGAICRIAYILFKSTWTIY